jgi:hypothetical protein
MRVILPGLIIGCVLTLALLAGLNHIEKKVGVLDGFMKLGVALQVK